jgi:hypothetical protein
MAVVTVYHHSSRNAAATTASLLLATIITRSSEAMSDSTVCFFVINIEYTSMLYLLRAYSAVQRQILK